MKTIVVLTLILVFFIGSNYLGAQTRPVVTLPASANNSPVISLGTAVDPASGRVVEGLAIVHYKKAPGHKPQHGNGDKTTDSNCYAYLAKGAKWKWVEPWLVNPQNTRGLDGTFVFNTLASSISKWEDATDGIVGNSSGINVLGDGTITASALVADTQSPDNQNEVYFADVSNQGAIAVTIVWGIFSGPISQRQLVEWDQVYDDVDFDWSTNGEVGKMDLENIVMHEVGHSVGMADLYSLSCAEATEYGYADLGETKKRDLHTGDITGVNLLY